MPKTQTHRVTWYFVVRIRKDRIQPGDTLTTQDAQTADVFREFATPISRKEYKQMRYGKTKGAAA